MDLSLKMFRDIPSVVINHYKEGNINWPMLIYTTVVHTAAAAGVYQAFHAEAKTLLWAFVLWPIR